MSVLQVVVVACAMSMCVGNPQFFPFSSVREYFDQKRQSVLRDLVPVQTQDTTTRSGGPQEVYIEPSRRGTKSPGYRSLPPPLYPAPVLPRYPATVPPQHKPNPVQTEHPDILRTTLPVDTEFQTQRPVYPKKFPSYQDAPKREKPRPSEETFSKRKIEKKNAQYHEFPQHAPESRHNFHPQQHPKLPRQPQPPIQPKFPQQPIHHQQPQFPQQPIHHQQPQFPQQPVQPTRHQQPQFPQQPILKQQPQPDPKPVNNFASAATNHAPQIHDLVANTYGDRQIASETGYGPNFGGGGDLAGSGGDRVEFQIHGQHGPHSYRFGFDTGKGHNRQFRYEERDTHGHVKGRYGFYDKQGKLQVVNYSAHPEHGFQAEGGFGKHPVE